MPDSAATVTTADTETGPASGRAGVVVRAFAGDGVRVSVGSPAENDAFLAAAARFGR